MRGELPFCVVLLDVGEGGVDGRHCRREFRDYYEREVRKEAEARAMGVTVDIVRTL